MKKIITISREYGSGGRAIGKKLAELLNYPFYDKEIIYKAAEESGLSSDFIKQNEQNIPSGWLYSLMIGSSFTSTGGMNFHNNTQPQVVPLVDQVFNAQRKVIIDLAKNGPAVIVGRCADYILTHCDEINPDDVLNVFIYAPLDFKVKNAITQDGIEESKAMDLVQLIDKRRANHYNTFTESTWGERSNYDIIIDSSLLGFDETSKLIAEIAQK